MKQYLLSVHSTEGEPVPSDEQMQKVYRDVEALNVEMREAGVWVFAGGLHPANTATTFRVQEGQVLVTDGPFAETKEQLGGFWVINAADLDAAMEWSRRATVACGGPVELRPFQDDPED